MRGEGYLACEHTLTAYIDMKKNFRRLNIGNCPLRKRYIKEKMLLTPSMALVSQERRGERGDMEDYR